VVDRRQERHDAMCAQLVAAAWELAHEHGLAGVSQRMLADKVGLAQPSLYSYFASKNDMYDAMFRDGNEQLVRQMESLDLPDDPRRALLIACEQLMTFATSDAVRYQLMFQRNLPGFTPSEESYAVASRFYEWHRRNLEAVGIHGQPMMDVFVALQAGLMEAQLANDPGGERWTRHLTWVIDMFLDRALAENRKETHGRTATNATSARVAPRGAHGDRSRREHGVVQQAVRDQLPHGSATSGRRRKAPG
jgi:AcrR family transcriptional regulator